MNNFSIHIFLFEQLYSLSTEMPPVPTLTLASSFLGCPLHRSLGCTCSGRQSQHHALKPDSLLLTAWHWICLEPLDTRSCSRPLGKTTNHLPNTPTCHCHLREGGGGFQSIVGQISQVFWPFRKIKAVNYVLFFYFYSAINYIILSPLNLVPSSSLKRWHGYFIFHFQNLGIVFLEDHISFCLSLPFHWAIWGTYPIWWSEQAYKSKTVLLLGTLIMGCLEFPRVLKPQALWWKKDLSYTIGPLY